MMRATSSSIPSEAARALNSRAIVRMRSYSKTEPGGGGGGRRPNPLRQKQQAIPWATPPPVHPQLGRSGSGCGSRFSDGRPIRCDSHRTPTPDVLLRAPTSPNSIFVAQTQTVGSATCMARGGGQATGVIWLPGRRGRQRGWQPRGVGWLPGERNPGSAGCQSCCCGCHGQKIVLSHAVMEFGCGRN
jgi:hypothetical protein